MSADVIELDLGDDATLERLVALQRASYAVEAELIGARELPPMSESPEALRACGETFLGARRNGRFALEDATMRQPHLGDRVERRFFWCCG